MTVSKGENSVYSKVVTSRNRREIQLNANYVPKKNLSWSTISYQNKAFLMIETVGKSEEYPYKEVERRLDSLRARLRKEIGYSVIR